MSVQMTFQPDHNWDRKQPRYTQAHSRRFGRFIVTAVLIIAALIVFALAVPVAEAPQSEYTDAAIALSEDCSPFGALWECVTSLSSG
jgi:hypothetical protein